MRHIARIVLALLLAFPAFAQTPVYQSGTITNGHAAGWISNRFIGDLESTTGFSQLTITSSTPTFCINSAATSGAYYQLCEGALNSGGTAGTLTYGAFGGASSLPFVIAVNGGAIGFNANAISINGSYGTANQPLLSGGTTGPMVFGTLSGNTSKFVTLTGSTTTGHCMQFDASGNGVDAGSGCGSAGVGPGVVGNLPYYNAIGSSIIANTNLNISGGALTIGLANTVKGSVLLTGSTSGVVTIIPQSIAGTYEFDLPNTAGTAGQFLTSQGGAGTAMTWTASSSPTWQGLKTANFNAVSGNAYCIDTTSGVVTMTLPAAPSDGDQIRFIDCTGNFAVNAMTVGRNAKKIMGSASDMTVNTTNAAATLIYLNVNSDWRMY